MRVLHCCDTWPPQVNGVSVVTTLMVDGLLARHVDVALITPRYPAHMHDIVGMVRPTIEHLTLPSVQLPVYKDVRVSAPLAGRVEKFVRDFRPNLVHVDTEFIVGRLGARAARRLGIPIVTSFHTNFAQYMASYGAPWLSRWVERDLVRFHQRSRLILTPSSVTKNWLNQNGLEHVDVFGRAVDIAVFSPEKRSDEWRRRVGAGGAKGAGGAGDVITFLHVGRLAAEKNLDLLLDGFAIARARLGARVQLIIAGDGPVARPLRARAPEGTTFIGFIDRDTELPGLYASCDAFLNTSLTETLGLVILESMASGLPVAAVAAGGIADHLRHEENGLAIDNTALSVADAVVRLTNDSDLRARLGAGGRRWAEHLSWEREMDRLVGRYQEVVAGARRTSGPSRALSDSV